LSVWWFLQPPSADALYERIAARMGDDSTESQPRSPSEISEVQTIITKFFGNYPDDPHGAQVREWEKELRLRQQRWEFDQRVSDKSTEDLSPIEQMYREAIGSARLNPTRAATVLQSLVDLYGQPGNEDDRTKQCLDAARDRLEQLRGEVEKLAKEQLALLGKRLDAADALRTIKPEQARAIYQAVIELYGDKPWAADMVRRARKALDQKPLPQ
jgi:eukaryotic-like serine/threonine-protein kinase